MLSGGAGGVVQMPLKMPQKRTVIVSPHAGGAGLVRPLPVQEAVLPAQLAPPNVGMSPRLAIVAPPAQFRSNCEAPQAELPRPATVWPGKN